MNKEEWRREEEMLRFREYIKAESLEQAYELKQKKGTVILGGMMWLQRQNRTVSRVVDLSDLGLDKIEETEEEFRIGAMVTLRQLELHEGLHTYTCGMMKAAVESIVGVQFRNGATIGGSVFGRFGFSDILPLFLVMDSYVQLQGAGMMPMKEFVEQGASNDVLGHIIIKKVPLKVAYVHQRNVRTDFPVLNCAVAKCDEECRVAVGARPGRAVLAEGVAFLLPEITEKNAEKLAACVQEQIVTGTNMRAGAEYRRHLVKVLTRRAALQLAEQ